MSSVAFPEAQEKNSCTYCQDIVTGLRIKCMECTDFDICLQCFISGAEIGPHKNTHDYKIVDSVSVVFGPRGWKASELIDLLNAVEYRGFGNWEDIAKEIKTRTADEAREEYISRFLEGTVGKVTWEDVLKNNTMEIIDMTEDLSDEGPLATLPKGGPLIHISQEKANQIGYMPLRDDFEWEYENNAESVVSGLIHLEDDTDVDTTLKLVHVDMYINKLRERARRKRVVKDFQLIPKFFNAQLLPETKTVKRKLNKDDSCESYATTLEQQLRKFSQFHTALEHSQFLDNLIREHRLRRRLAELYRYRTNGIKTIRDCEVFDELSPESASNAGVKATQSLCGERTHPVQRKKRRKGVLFNRKKVHVPHRIPGNYIPLRRCEKQQRAPARRTAKCLIPAASH